MEQNFNGTTANRPRVAIFSTGVNTTGNASPVTGRTQYLCQIDGTNGNVGESFARNVSVGQNTFGAYSSTNTTAFLIFAGNQVGTGIAGHFHSRIDSYSIGAAFTTAGRTAYHDALTTFRAALGRT
jgi:deoxyhypusine synthase